ncbi:siderophore-interacting protein [Roseateles koreensis]|uniref:Siderophore-interacting protein n=1 Tax=Roseateles koreensis TaxID=2987526 RepID=A0ABT5KWF5_9BURK|nr:siderophore-interacting protein [Roseateles koreensis]MDC8787259.1 siderophore-interacting protein [Roseateles koreensis]
MESISTERRIQRVRYELQRREVSVVRVEAAGAQFVRVTFAGEDLAGFVSGSFDDHIKLMLEDAAGEMVRRDYTPRKFDKERRELTLEFALHGHGQASDWARNAAVGQRVLIGGPRGSMIIPMDYAWHVLIGDATALPAIHRRLEELPQGARAIVLAQIEEGADRRLVESAAEVTAHWVSSDDELLAAVRGLALPPGEGFVWCAGEARSMARLRDVLLGEKAHPKEAMKVAAYWKQGASDFHENLSL